MNKPGIILITTLLIVMVLSVISMQISKNFFLSAKREAYLDFKNHSYQMLASSEKQAIKAIQKQIASYQSKLRTNDPIFKNKFFYDDEMMALELEVKEGSNCLNLNSIFKFSNNKFKVHEPHREWLARYLRLKLVNEQDIESFIDQLLDWVDVDNQPLNFGAENYFYIGPMSAIQQFTPKRLLVDISEIKNFPIMKDLNFTDLTSALCVIPGSSNQFLNINTLLPKDSMLVASFFEEQNLEYALSQLLDIPEDGYDDINIFAQKFTNSVNFPLKVLSTNSKTFILKSKAINESYSAELESLVILDISNSAKIINRNFIF